MKMYRKDELQICDMYDYGFSTSELAKIWSLGKCTIWHIIIRNGYKLRTKSEALKGKLCGKNNPMYGKHHSDKAKQKISDNLKGQNNPNFGKHWVYSKAIKQKMSVSHSTPENIQKSLKSGSGIKCYYENKSFPSLSERDCYIELRKQGYLVIHNFLGRFDFLLNKKVVVEFHPFDFNLTDKQYYIKRKKLLNEYGYKNLKLIVIKDLKEIESLKYEFIQ